MSDEKETEKETVELLKALRAELNNRVDACIEAIVPEVPWTPREYVSGKFFVDNRSETDTCPPGAIATVLFCVECINAETEVLGLPETRTKFQGIEHNFIFDSFAINDEDAPHFDIDQIFIGNKAVWSANTKVPATRFSASALSVVKFDRQVQKNLMIIVQATNKSDKPRSFRAKIIGREQIIP